MDNHRRMTRMLGALVASMTIGAFCLDWMQPAQTATPSAPGIGLMAVARTWEGIRIEAHAQDGSFRPEDTHFLIYRNGNRVQTPSWAAQRVLGSAPVVQVTLVAATGQQGLTSAQRLAARDLVRELQQNYAIPADRVRGGDKLGPATVSQAGTSLAIGAALAIAD